MTTATTLASGRVAIVGAGLAGLTAAAYLARRGHQVRVYDRGRAAGGRARTRTIAGFSLNLGPHALYSEGAARAALDDLGVAWTGARAGGPGALAVRHGRAHGLPIGLVSLLTTGLFGVASKLAAGRLLSGFDRIDTDELGDLTLAAWLDDHVTDAGVRQLVEAMARVATYTHSPERVSAAAVLRQMQMAARTGVYYVDGGWQTLVDGLRAVAEQAGAVIETGRRIDSLAQLDADAVVVAADPATASSLVGRDFGHLTPVRAACLELALDRLPRPRVWFAVGIDAPTYLSVHTRFARLAPEAGAVIHVARYLGPDDGPVKRPELEWLADIAQPGWRQHKVLGHFSPNLTVSHAMATGLPRPAVDQGDGVYLAGDWVGDEGLLADAAVASGRRAASLIDARLAAREVVAA